MRRKSLIVACVLIAAAFCSLSGRTHADEKAADTAGADPLNLERYTVVSNVSFLGESLSGLSYSTAVDKVNGHLMKMTLADFRLHSTDDESLVAILPAGDFGLTYDRTVAENALKDKVLDGNLLERYKMAKDYQRTPFEVKETVSYDASKIEAFLKENTDAWTQNPVSASVSGKSGRLVVTPGQNGRSYDYTEAFAKLTADLDSLSVTEQYYDIPVTETITEPELTTERAEGFTIIGSYTTEYPTVTTTVLANRESNLETSLRFLSGRRYAPGEEISALNMYGAITAENGYLHAPTFADGGHSANLGGGICQTTTTLYNAVILAELEVVYRMHHSLLVAYVEASRDAMVYAPYSDFKFRNTSSDYIFIEGYIDKKAETITIYIIGHEDHDPGHSVAFESEILERIMPAINIIDNPEWPIGFSTGSRKFVLQGDGPQSGITSRLWKITYENGVEVKRELFNAKDTYKPATATYLVAPDTTVVLEFSNKRNHCYLQPYVRYLDGTSIGVDPIRWSDDEKAEFNERMTALMAAKGYVWPDEGTTISVDVGGGERRQIWPPETPSTETESEPESEPESGTEGGEGNEGGTTPPPSETAAPPSGEIPSGDTP